MAYVADLHIHSRYAYACSKELSLENLAAWARIKGIDLLATGDFTHPAWFAELQQKLMEVSPGLYRLGGVHFVLGAEVNCVYTQTGRRHRVHLLIFAPNIAAAINLNRMFARFGRLDLDGRLTLAISAPELVSAVFEANRDCIIIPAHIWTPWYGIYGSKSGFDHFQECFQDFTPRIPAVETGLSSDPAMNWHIPELADKTMVSFSDAHSLANLGRESTAFEGDLSYAGLAQALATNKVAYSVEFYPEQGKYHHSGHRKCGVSQTPEQTRQEGQRCPNCGRPLTIGVLHRTRLLSTAEVTHPRGPDGFVRAPDGRPPFIRLVPLLTIIGQAHGHGLASKRAQAECRRVVQELGSELNVLLHASHDDLLKVAGERLAQGIWRARLGHVQTEPGYDGLYGRVSVWPEEDAALKSREMAFNEIGS